MSTSVFNRTSVLNLSVAGNAFAYGGTHAPDVVGNIRVDQAWDLFQISAVACEVDASYNILGAGGAPTNLSEISGHPDTKWGGSVMAALQIKNLPTGAGDDIKVDASYAVGDTKNVISTSGGSPSFAMFGPSGFAYQSIGFGQTSDAVYAPVGLALGGGGAAWHRDQSCRHRRSQARRILPCPRCVQPQLGSVLVVQLVRQRSGRSLRRHCRCGTALAAFDLGSAKGQ